MSAEFQRNEPELHAQTLGLLRQAHAEGLVSPRRR
jgi:hypothetical protein